MENYVAEAMEVLQIVAGGWRRCWCAFMGDVVRNELNFHYQSEAKFPGERGFIK